MGKYEGEEMNRLECLEASQNILQVLYAQYRWHSNGEKEAEAKAHFTGAGAIVMRLFNVDVDIVNDHVVITEL